MKFVTFLVTRSRYLTTHDLENKSFFENILSFENIASKLPLSNFLTFQTIYNLYCCSKKIITVNALSET